ncbi:27201_t:CDS:2 [Gigaspora margarita]|uniref:27201_t:CDS:1 n=1 Tax=Gigaspora margarita TaxID=4874 RepID=A0ABN7UN96_GIGMA|nr:27201_t:CDS:2 [Gigaspora margarita]
MAFNHLQNCILSNSDPLTIERATEEQENLEKNKEKYLHQILSSEIVNTISGFTTYINDNKVVPTEKFLDDKQIVELVTQSIEFDSSSSDEELVLIKFKTKDLKTLKKYNNIVKRKYLANMKQKTLENFF